MSQGEPLDGVQSSVPRDHCPACGAAVPATTDQILHCDQCGAEFFASDPQSGATEETTHFDGGKVWPLVYEHPRSRDREPSSTSDTELSGIRIRQLSTLRRGAYRSRSYCIIVAAAGVVGAIELGRMAFEEVHHNRWSLRPAGYLLFGVAMLLVAGHFLWRAIELTREIKSSALSDPVEPPDFSSLGDGSQQVRNLEQINAPLEPPP